MRKALFLFALGLGCAGESFDDVGLLEQAYRAKHSPSFQFGSSTGDSHLACNRTSTGQVCSIPKSKTIQVVYSNSFTNSQIALGEVARATIDNETNFLVERKLSGDPLSTSQLRIIVQPGAVSGNKSANIDGYSGVQFTSPVNLTEGVQEDDPVGSYQKHGGCIATIDIDDINAKTTVTAERERLIKHAVAHGILACIGMGSRTDSGAVGKWIRREITPLGTNTVAAMGAGDKCRADSFLVADNGDFSEEHSAACND